MDEGPKEDRSEGDHPSKKDCPISIQDSNNDVQDDERMTSNWKKRGSLGRQRSSLSQQSYREKRLGDSAQDHLEEAKIVMDKPSLDMKTRKLASALTHC